MKNGSSWPLDELSEEDREKDLEEALKFGNHKRASDLPDLLVDLCSDDVVHGYALPLPLHTVKKIKGVRLNPMNIAAQHSIDENGQIIDKDRLTHNCSMRFQSGKSLNDRVRQEELLPCVFGATSRRIINWAVAA